MHPAFALLTGVAALALAATGSAAHASTAVGDPDPGVLYSAADAPLGAPVEVRIDMRGEVAPRCELSRRPVFAERMDLNHDGDLQAGFGVDCNAPFTLRVTSGAGGMAALDATPGAASLVPYELAVEVGTDGGRRDLGWCASEQLVESGAAGCAFGGARAWSSEGDTAIDRTGALRLRWQGRSEAALPALGRYGDAIVIELEVRP